MKTKKSPFTITSISSPRVYSHFYAKTNSVLKNNVVNGIDIISKLAPLGFTAISLLIGIWQFQQQQAINETQEFKRKVWDKKLDAYNTLAAITSQVMVSVKDKNFDSLGTKYKQVYWSTIPLFDSSVERYMNDFEEEINSILIGEGRPGVLRNRGYGLLKACKSSLDSSFINVNQTKHSFIW